MNNIKRWKYRKIKPKDVAIMKELKECGFSYEEISTRFKISCNSVQYHLNPKYKKQHIKRVLKYWGKLNKKQKRERGKKHQKYQRKYIIERYRKDKEFHDRFLGHILRSQMKIRNQRREEGKCTMCGGSRKDKTFFLCEKCREKNKQKNKKNVDKLKKEERCTVCGKKVDNKKFLICSRCRTKHKKVRSSRKKKGLCTKCGVKLKDKNYTHCEHCREMAIIYYKKWRNIKNHDIDDLNQKIQGK